MAKGLKKVLTLAIGVVMAFSLVACSSSDSNKKEDGTKKAGIVDQIKDSKKLILATNPEFSPFEFITVKDGKNEIVGADIMFAEEIAKDLGVKLEVKSMNFDNLIEALNAGNADMVIAGMNPTPKRRENVNFSELYYGDSPQVLVINKANEGKIKSVADLKGLKIGAQKGSVQEEVVANEFKDSTAKAVSNIPNLIQELKNNTIDALVLEKPVAEDVLKGANSSDLIIAPFEVKVDYSGYAVAIKKGNEDLVKEVNKTIERITKDNLMEKFINDARAIKEKK